MMPEASQKQQYAQMTCLFLADQLRQRKLSTSSVGSIAQTISRHINLMDTDRDFLGLLKELSKDFAGLEPLEKQVLDRAAQKARRQMEDLVHSYATDALASDPAGALRVIQAAAEPDATVERLTSQFPELQAFIEAHARF